MRKNQKGYTIIELSIVILFIVGAIGWIWNIVKIVGMTHTMTGGFNDPHILMFIFRCIGVIAAPLGCILGYIPT